MTKDEAFNLVKEMVEDNIKARKCPYHTTINELLQKAKETFKDYDREQFLEIFRQLVKERRLFAGNTSQDIWISIKRNNIKYGTTT